MSRSGIITCVRVLFIMSHFMLTLSGTYGRAPGLCDHPLSPVQHQPLVRAVGLFSLTAISINGMVGSGIFVLPAQVARILGPAALSAYLIAGLAVGLVVLCFAEVAS